jgi:hypothetical protein
MSFKYSLMGDCLQVLKDAGLILFDHKLPLVLGFSGMILSKHLEKAYNYRT